MLFQLLQLMTRCCGHTHTQSKSVQPVLANNVSTLTSFVLVNPISISDVVSKGFVVKAIGLEHLYCRPYQQRDEMCT